MSTPNSPTADVSARVAWADDAGAIARVQARAWRDLYADLLPGEALTEEAFAEHPQAWQALLSRPKDARQRALVALERNRVVGFALTAPAMDPDCDPVTDGELADITVDPAERRAGHGSRLLQAGIDTLRADRFTRAVTWVSATDDTLRRFFEDAGWAADTAHRELDLDGSGNTLVKQVRLHTSLDDG